MFGLDKKAQASQPGETRLVVPGYEDCNALGSSFDYGMGTLNPDGSFTLQGMRLVQDVISRVSPLAIGDSALRWTPGPGGELELLAPDGTTVFKFLPDRKLWLGQKRPALSALQAMLSRAWQPRGPACELGPLKFLEDGDIQVPDGRRLAQSVSISDCTLGDARIEKKAGEGEEFLVQAPDATHALVYMGRCWFYQRRPT